MNAQTIHDILFNNYLERVTHEPLTADKIHIGARNYERFKTYAGITEQDRTTKSHLKVYDNPVLRASIQWVSTYYGYMPNLGEMTLTDSGQVVSLSEYTGLADNITEYPFEIWLFNRLQGHNAQ